MNPKDYINASTLLHLLINGLQDCILNNVIECVHSCLYFDAVFLQFLQLAQLLDMRWKTCYNRNMHIQLQGQVLTYQFLKKGTAKEGNLAKRVTWVLLRNTQHPGGVVAH